MMLGVSRQRVLQLTNDHADINAWVYYEQWSWQADLYEISVRDLLRWAVKLGRVKTVSDIRLGFPHAEQLLSEIKAELASGLAADKTDVLE